MEYRILGPVEVRDPGGTELKLGGAIQQRILATLILEANRSVSLGRLAEAAWGADAPAGARRLVQNRVGALRTVLAAVGAADAIITTSQGYRLAAAPEQVDSSVFAGLCREAEEAADPRAFRRALAFWRGPALGGLGGAVLGQAAVGLEEKRLNTYERCIELELAAASHHQVIPELAALVAAHPLRERLVALLMTALYRAGRPGEALAAYRDLAQRLADEQGLDPSAELQDLHRQILRADPVLSPKAGVVAVPAPTLCLLPSDIADFTGREEQIEEVRRLLGQSDLVTAVVVSAIAGKGGVGKTALAVHAAHGLRTEFPDGQLYVNLDGAGPQPSNPLEVLDGLLRALGVEGRMIPAGLSERAALYRARLASRRILVVLDNAADEAQVRPLLPGSAGCGVLITSRNRLLGLEGVRVIDLDVLEPAQAIRLLGQIAGSERVAAEPEAAADIVRLCGCLPLAVRVAGARLVARRHRPLSWLADRLADERRRLDELSVGDLEVRASLALSYEGLKPELQRAFRLLGLVRAPDFAPWVLAALLDAPLDQAEDLLEDLVDAQLVEVAGDGTRYRLHDLLRVYAQEQLEALEAEADRQSALERFLGACLWLVERAMEHPSARSWVTIHGIAERWTLPDIPKRAFAYGVANWFEKEVSLLGHAVRLACAACLDELTWDLAQSMAGLFSQTGRPVEWRDTNEMALSLVNRAGNHRGMAALMLGRGLLEQYVDGVSADAWEAQAAAVFHAVNDRHGLAMATACRSAAALAYGAFDQAEAMAEESLSVFREVGDLRFQVYILRVLGAIRLAQGRTTDAVAYFRDGLAVARGARYRLGEAHLQRWLARTLSEQEGQRAEALALVEQSLATFIDLGDRGSEAIALVDAADLYYSQGRNVDCQVTAESAITISRDLGDRSAETSALRSLARAKVDAGRPDEAVPHLLRSVKIARDIERIPLAAQALVTLGEAYQALGRVAAAQEAFRAAADIYVQLGTPLPPDLVDKLAGQGQLTHSSVPSANT